LFTSVVSDHFKKHFDKLTKKDNMLKKRLTDKIKEMCIAKPEGQTELVGILKGKYRIRVGDYRLIYAYCEDCKKHNYQIYNKCYECSTKSDDTLVLFDVIHRSNDYDL